MICRGYSFDYSNMPLSFFHHKICLPFTILWFFLRFAVVFAHDAITFFWMSEGGQPEYWILGERVWMMP